jgi:hypothetical protein
MTLLQHDPLTQLAFSVYENKGVFAVLLGSGLSRAAEIPTGWEITLDLVRRVALAQGVTAQDDWAKWYRDKTGQEPNYSVLLEDIASSPDERRSILHRYMEPTEQDREEGRKVPTAAHHSIAQLVRSGHIRVIVTTNFDRLMENALRERGVEPTIVSSVDALRGAEPLTHSQCYLVKLHGDYKDARILNTDRELSAYAEEYNRLLDRIFDEHGLIICGWSGDWDYALRAAFLRAPNRRYPVYWATRSALSSSAQELVNHRQARLVTIAGADEFFKGLQQRMETLEQSQRQNPLSIDLLVNSTKRFLSRSEYRIQLDELFSQETGRLLEQLDTGKLNPQGQWSQDEFRARIRLYQSMTEPLARMAGALGRWGDGADLPLVLDVLSALWVDARRVGGGLTVWLNIRPYPAVLVFTAYGLGLVRARRWPTLHALFMSLLATENREPQNVVSALFLSGEGAEQRLWQEFEGLDRRKTPLSDHLLVVMGEWKSSFVGVEPNFELMFERFETLGSLASFESHDEAELENAAKAQSLPVLAWMPMGRVGWHGQSARVLVEELESDGFAAELLSAGFAKNRRRFLQLFIQNFKLYASRMSWS